MTATYWLSIGRNVGHDEPMTGARWAQFKDDIEAMVPTIIACVDGQSAWQGVPEQTYLVLTEVRTDDVLALRSNLSILALEYGQEAIGFVGGTGYSLVHASGTDRP